MEGAWISSSLDGGKVTSQQIFHEQEIKVVCTKSLNFQDLSVAGLGVTYPNILRHFHFISKKQLVMQTFTVLHDMLRPKASTYHTARTNTKTHTLSARPNFSLPFSSFSPRDVSKTCFVIQHTWDCCRLCLSLAVGLVRYRALVAWECLRALRMSFLM